MLQLNTPQDFYIATAVQYSVWKFAEKAATQLGVGVTFEVEGQQEIVRSISGNALPALKIGQGIVKTDLRYDRPTEVESLLGDPFNAKAELGWVHEITLKEMIAEIVALDFQKTKYHVLLKNSKDDTYVSIEQFISVLQHLQFDSYSNYVEETAMRRPKALICGGNASRDAN